MRRPYLTMHEKDVLDEQVDSYTFRRVGERTTICTLRLKTRREVTAVVSARPNRPYIRDLGQALALRKAVQLLERMTTHEFI